MSRPRAMKEAKAAGCTKVAYTSKAQADAIAAPQLRKTPVTQRAYECQWCGHWHLTSQLARSSVTDRNWRRLLSMREGRAA